MAVLASGARAPAFALPAAAGGERSLVGALERGMALVVFFSLECRACEVSFLAWDRMVEAYGDAGCPLLAISLDPADTAAGFWERSGVSFEVLADTGNATARAYGIECTPALFLVGDDGRVLASHDAFDRTALNALSALIAERLGVPPVAVREGEAPEFVPGCAVHWLAEA